MTATEVESITGYKMPAKQEAELRRQGFYRARRSPTTGEIILERAHYQAVCSTGGKAANEPQVRDPIVRPPRAKGARRAA